MRPALTSTDPVAISITKAIHTGDVVAIDALLDLGADIEATGAIFTGGAPLSDAVHTTFDRVASDAVVL